MAPRCSRPKYRGQVMVRRRPKRPLPRPKPTMRASRPMGAAKASIPRPARIWERTMVSRSHRRRIRSESQPAKAAIEAARMPRGKKML